MGRPTRAQALIRAAREGQPVQRIEPARTTCPRCGTEQWADADGQPRYHLRDAVPADADYRTDLPVKVTCD